ncbi:MAG: hypothetical protein WCW40_01095 [Bacteroidota bacterium]|jgi:hypothetical protein
MKSLVITLLIVLWSLTAAAQSQEPPNVVHFKQLQKILPVAAPEGFTREKPKGQTISNSSVASSITSVDFTAQKDEKRLRTMEDGTEDSVDVEVHYRIIVEISDYAGLGEAMAVALQMITGTVMQSETEEGYEKSVTFNGYKGIEKSHEDPYSKYCSLQLVVGDRFIVTVTGKGLTDIPMLQSLLNSMDLKKLQAMK